MEDIEIFVAEYTHGSNNERTVEILYVGTIAEDAVDKIYEKFDDDDIHAYAYIQTWINGVKKKETLIK
jgi:hypothetical protein